MSYEESMEHLGIDLNKREFPEFPMWNILRNACKQLLLEQEPEFDSHIPGVLSTDIQHEHKDITAQEILAGYGLITNPTLKVTPGTTSTNYTFTIKGEERKPTKIAQEVNDMAERLFTDSMHWVLMVADAPEITDVKSFNNKAVKVWFKDGEHETAVCSDDDQFSLETGITICVLKHILRSSDKDDGTKKYNDYIKKAIKTAEKNRADEKKAAEEKAAEKHRKEKEEKRKAARKERKRNERIKDMRTALALAERDKIKVPDKVEE